MAERRQTETLGPKAWGPNAAGRLKPDAARTLSDDAIRGLHEDIVAGRFQPGEKLKPEDLKTRYAVGTSPIREALLRLSAEGLVLSEGQRGFRVPPTSEAELDDIADVRCTLSDMALRRAVARGDDEWEARIVAAFHRLQVLVQPMIEDPDTHRDQWEQRNRDFHAALEEGCGSPWLLHFSNIAYSQSERYRRRFVHYPVLLPKAQEEHAAIMEAALARDAETACRHLLAHIMDGVEIVRAAMRQSLPEREKARASR
ncbi:FCD domain-containing protein [Methylobacterium nonmethylotrophicum]|uniref:FCD domain-containing protein n=1 Tax=Methylobacterium nonmethylotrophicum TaxID=1141884 RepID=A0A4Z0NGC3_9HYPH|nr:FCD domain-containing protein [Methylobacterium nonmethylotrophicum]TGD95260.1 FCD domain-containing protein [Methylobacterium nonmethylotrophicum]